MVSTSSLRSTTITHVGQRADLQFQVGRAEFDPNRQAFVRTAGAVRRRDLDKPARNLTLRGDAKDYRDRLARPQLGQLLVAGEGASYLQRIRVRQPRHRPRRNSLAVSASALFDLFRAYLAPLLRGQLRRATELKDRLAFLSVQR